MIDDPEPPVSLEDARDRSLPEDVRDLAAQARAYAEAELAYQKSRAGYATAGTRDVALYGVAAAVLVFFALMALVLGLVLALTPILTAWGATALVCAALLVAAFGFARIARSRWKRMVELLGQGGAA